MPMAPGYLTPPWSAIPEECLYRIEWKTEGCTLILGHTRRPLSGDQCRVAGDLPTNRGHIKCGILSDHRANTGIGVMRRDPGSVVVDRCLGSNSSVDLPSIDCLQIQDTDKLRSCPWRAYAV
jgi:hypothetical protein